MERHGISGFELVVVAVGSAVLSVLGVAWGGAVLALLVTGHPTAVPASAVAGAVRRLPQHLSDPSAAWTPPYDQLLPNAVAYWLCTAVVAVALGATAVLLFRWLSGSAVGTS